MVILMGYMGSGKSTIGLNLATVLDYKFIDLDQYIEAKEHKSIPEIFSSKGEIYFRKIESLYLNEILNSHPDIVLSLGGGTPCYANNLDEILSHPKAKTFYLKLALPELVDRLIIEKDKRPIINHLQTEEELLEFVGKHLFERQQFYNKAEFIINLDGKDVKTSVESIITKLI